MKVTLLILVMTISLNGKAQSINNILDNFKKEINPESNSQKVTIVNLKDSSYNWSWDYINSVWDMPNKTIYTYNLVYQEIGYLMSSYNSGSWDASDRGITYTYDSNSNLLEQTNQQWNLSTLSWIDFSKITNTYDASNNLLTRLFQQWNNNTLSWNNTLYIVYTYDANNNQLSLIKQTWNSAGSTWSNMSKETATYNASNHYTSYLTQYWNSSNLAWENYRQLINMVYSTGNLISEELQFWNNTSLIYESIGKNYYTYNANNNKITMLNQTWDTPTSAWIDSEKDTYTYDSNNNQITLLNQVWITTTNTWENNYRRYDYYASSVGVKELVTKNSLIELYPNPATSNVTISMNNEHFNEVILTDVTGKVLITEKNTNYTSSMNINTDYLTPGVYFVAVKNDGDSIAYKKFIKE